MGKMILAFILSSGALLSVANASEQLTATIIGSGSPIYNEQRAGASVLVSVADTHILVDMGNGTQANLHKIGFDPRHLSALLFTHHHLDHNEEFVPMLIQTLLGRGTLEIVGPPNTVKLTQTNLALYAEDIAYRLGKTGRSIADREQDITLNDIQGGEQFSIADIKISTLEVPHSIHTIAYRFDYADQSIVISGDLTYSEALATLAKEADYMIIDSGGMIMKDAPRRNRNGAQGEPKSKQHVHLNLDDSSTIAAKAQVKNLVYTHFNATDVDSVASLKVIRNNYTGKVIFANDLMVLNQAPNTQQSRTQQSYAIVDTGQRIAYSNDQQIALPSAGETFFGQDASYIINAPSYTNNHDGTISDNVTGLVWQQQMGEKLSLEEALQQANSVTLGGYNDWRVPSIKELYSLMLFSGSVKGEQALVPFIDTSYFSQPLGDSSNGEREIDAQTWSSTEYVAKTMNKDETVFGVNFVDGRIKGYPKYNPRTGEANKMYVRFVRGNTDYGNNHFVNNNDGTISDRATGLMWQQTDSQAGLNWQDALHYAQQSSLGGYTDWRLPNAKELQSIVDYTRSPATSDSAAIDAQFNASTIRNEAGDKDYPYYWTSTTHLDGPVPEKGAVYVAFGKALGEMHGNTMDVHGAGSQRSDPKTGEAMSRGPQGDMIRVHNYVRLVRGGEVNLATGALQEKQNQYSQTVNTQANDLQKNNTGKARQESTSAKRINNRFITRFDKNNDAKVAQSEFSGGAQRFNHFDKNKDGFITLDEAPTGPPKKRQ